MIAWKEKEVIVNVYVWFPFLHKWRARVMAAWEGTECAEGRDHEGRPTCLRVQISPLILGAVTAERSSLEALTRARSAALHRCQGRKEGFFLWNVFYSCDLADAVALTWFTNDSCYKLWHIAFIHTNLIDLIRVRVRDVRYLKLGYGVWLRIMDPSLTKPLICTIPNFPALYAYCYSVLHAMNCIWFWGLLPTEPVKLTPIHPIFQDNSIEVGPGAVKGTLSTFDCASIYVEKEWMYGCMNVWYETACSVPC
jgi:hypothetical protein